MVNVTPKTLLAQDVHVAFGGIVALGGVDLRLGTGQILGLIGPNGAGKTTMVNVLSGFQRPTRGSVTLDGAHAAERGPDYAARAGIARSFQAGRLFKDMTVEENLVIAGLGGGMRKARAQANAHEILEWLDCADMADHRCDALSYGNERRISIGRVLAMRPAFALLDEPASGMNDSECDALMRLISSIPSRFGCGVLLIEHNMQVIMGACHRIHVLDGGKSLAEGSPKEIQTNAAVRRAYLGDSSGSPALPI